MVGHTNIGRTEAESVLDLAGDDPVEGLRWCLALLGSKEMEVSELRSVRRQIVTMLREQGQTLEAIGAGQGRSKQIVRQWCQP